MKYLTLLLLFIGCSDPDTYYTVVVNKIDKNKDAYYCTYHIDSISEPKYPKSFFLDDCGKYNVSDTLTLKL